MELQVPMQAGVTGGVLDNYMLLILCIMVIAGLLGGLANYFMSGKDTGFLWRDLIKYVVLGIVAALTVPLFLNMISSNLLAAARGRPIDLFVFAGFCLIFVLFSRRFLEGVSNRFLQQMSQMRKG